MTTGYPPAAQRFSLAPMSGVIYGLTIALLALPVCFTAIALAAGPSRGIRPPLIVGWSFAWVALFIAAVYAWVWLRFRPTAFVVGPDALDVEWPMKRQQLARSSIARVELIDRRELRRRIGFGVRVGAGGLWGGFGALWTWRRGVVRMYISRVDRFVWIECHDGPPWLITPERTEEFVRAVSPAMG